MNDTASFTATGCTFSGNTATGGLAGICRGAAIATAGQGKGGAIFVRTGGTAMLNDPVFQDNDAADEANTATDNDQFWGDLDVSVSDLGGIVVDDLADDGDAAPGDTVIATPGRTVTLRAALDELRAVGASGAITFDPALFSGGPQTITVAASDLIIESQVTITGPGAGTLTISGGDTRRIFQVISGGLDISEVTLANGYGKGGNGGTGTGGGGGALGAGGAIYIFDGEVNAANVVFADNEAQGGNGGDGTTNNAGGGGGGVGDGVNANGGAASGNNGGAGGAAASGAGGSAGTSPFPNPGGAGGPGGGGGGGASSDFSQGTGGAGGFGGGGGGSGRSGSFGGFATPGGAGGFGGGGGGAGWHSHPNSTPGGAGGAFAGSGGATPNASSSAHGGGGGGAGLGGAVFVNDTAIFDCTECTFSGNRATNGLPGASSGTATAAGPGQGKGGGLFVRDGGTATLTDPVFEDNTAADAGATATDNPSFGGTVTITFTDPLAFVVDTLIDTADALLGDTKAEDANGDTSLRAAVQEAVALGAAAAITFDPALFSGGPGTISLALGEILGGTAAITITGPGSDTLTVDGGGLSRIFNFSPGGAATISGMTLANGTISGAGGAISTIGELTVEGVVFSGNTALNGAAISGANGTALTVRGCTFTGGEADSGGAISVTGLSSTVLIGGSTFSGNTAVVEGGALRNGTAALTVFNSTFSGNTCDGPGGAIYSASSATRLLHCTITGNRADNDDDEGGLGGGVALDVAGSIEIQNCIIAGNFSASPGSASEFVAPDVAASALAPGGHSIIGSPAGILGGLDATNADLETLGIADISEVLAPLADNGGPTFTCALPEGSPGINFGSNALAVDPDLGGVLALDQRGAGFARNAAGTVDAGAFEAQADTNVPAVTVERAAGQADPVNTLPIVFDVVFSEPVDGFELGDVQVTGVPGLSFQLVQTSRTAYELTIDAAGGDGTITVSVPAGIAQDPFGNVNLASAGGDNTVVYDTTGPGAVIQTTATSPTDIEPVPFTIVFDEPVSGFTVGDLSVVNGNAANFAGSGASYGFDVFPGNDGLVEVSVPAGAATDAAGNASAAASLAVELVYDTVAPSALSVTRLGAALTNAATVDFAVAFSEAVTGVDAADFVIDAPGTLTGATVAGVTGLGEDYIVTVNTGAGEGLLSIDVAANGTVLDAADRPLGAPFTSGEAYQVDRVAPTATLVSGAPDPTTSASIPVTVTFSESVTGFGLGGVTVLNGAAQGLAGSGASYTFAVVAAADGLVTVTVGAGAAQDAAGNASTASTALTRDYVDLGLCDTEFHAVDQNQDNKFSLSELLRAIQFYNSETYHCEAGTEDGYAPGIGDIASCCPHDSDYNLQNWSISLSELLRSIQFYNTGAYYHCPADGTEDGYCPGIAP